MKKNYLIAIAVFLSTSVFAQLSLVTTFTAANELKQEQIREDNYFQGHVFYFGQGSTTSSQLYKTDGNTITLVKDFGPVYPEGETATGISISNFNQTSDKLFFTRYSMRFGTTAPLDAISELWTSDVQPKVQSNWPHIVLREPAGLPLCYPVKVAGHTINTKTALVIS